MTNDKLMKSLRSTIFIRFINGDAIVVDKILNYRELAQNKIDRIPSLVIIH
jgi:hypothetical protein